MVNLANLQKHLGWDGVSCSLVKSEEQLKVEISGKKRSIPLVEKIFENYDALYNFSASCQAVWIESAEVNADNTVKAVMGWLK